MFKSAVKLGQVIPNSGISENRQKKTSLDTNDSDYGKIHMIPIDQLVPNRSQPRRLFDSSSILRLADSIRQYGILQPLTVRRMEDTNGAIFELIAGERRLRASKLIGLSSVPCIIVNADNRRSAELAIIENLQREDLNIFEQASSIASLIEIYSLTQEEIACKLSVSQSFVANKLRLLRLTAPERAKILGYGLSERHARALLKVNNADLRIKIIDYISSHNLNVAATEIYIDKILSESASEKKPIPERRVVLKDIRIFYNSIDKAISLVKQAGIDIESQKQESDDLIELTIRIPKKKQ